MSASVSSRNSAGRPSLSIAPMPCDCAHLARPARRQRLRGQDRQTVFEAEIAGGGERDVRGAVGAVVIDDDHMERARIVLLEQRADRAADDVGFVARRHDGDERGPCAAARDLGVADGVDRRIG